MSQYWSTIERYFGTSKEPRKKLHERLTCESGDGNEEEMKGYLK
jgi:hypothetical protein